LATGEEGEMQYGMSIDQLQEVRGRPVYSSDGEKIGVVEEIFTDIETGQPEWIGIGTGFLRMKRALVPTQGAEIREDALYVAYPKEQVKGSPDIDEKEVGQETEAQLYSYYGLQYSERRSETGLPEGAGTTAGTTEGEGSLTRAEEEIRVGKRSVDAGRVRLRKWVETEPVSEDVSVRRETARVEREPIDRPAAEADIGEQEVEVPLRAEEPVVAKETVAKERVSLGKDVQTETETVGGEVRRERVDVQGDDVTISEGEEAPRRRSRK